MTDAAILGNTISALLQKEATNIYETRRIAGNIDAIETFEMLLDDIDFGNAEPRLGAQTAPHVIRQAVGISVRPEVTLHSKSKTGNLVGDQTALSEDRAIGQRTGRLCFGNFAGLLSRSSLERWCARRKTLHADRPRQRSGLPWHQIDKAAHERCRKRMHADRGALAEHYRMTVS